jgi:hypothetical protein
MERKNFRIGRKRWEEPEGESCCGLVILARLSGHHTYLLPARRRSLMPAVLRFSHLCPLVSSARSGARRRAAPPAYSVRRGSGRMRGGGDWGRRRGTGRGGEEALGKLGFSLLSFFQRRENVCSPSQTSGPTNARARMSCNLNDQRWVRKETTDPTA